MRERRQNTLIIKELAGKESRLVRLAAAAKGETGTPTCPCCTATCVSVHAATPHASDADLIVRLPASAQGLKYELQVFTAETRRRYVTF